MRTPFPSSSAFIAQRIPHCRAAFPAAVGPTDRSPREIPLLEMGLENTDTQTDIFVFKGTRNRLFEEEDDQRDQKGPNKWQMRVSVCVFLISPERDWLAGWLCSDDTSAAAAAGRSRKVVVWRSRKRIGRKGANLIRDGPLTHAALGIVSISRCAQSGRRCSPLLMDDVESNDPSLRPASQRYSITSRRCAYPGKR